MAAVQPFNKNLLRPCPMLENADTLPRLVKESGAHNTDLVEQESPEQLREKTAPYAEQWAPIADKMWMNPDDKMNFRRVEFAEGLCATDVSKLKRQGRMDMTTGILGTATDPNEDKKEKKKHLLLKK